MMEPNLPASVTEFSRDASPASAGGMTARRFTFVASAPSGTVARREFSHPRPMVALEQRVDLAELAATTTIPAGESLLVVMVPASAAGSHTPEAISWLTGSTPTATARPISIALKSGASVDWRPGLAILRCTSEESAEFLSVLIDFAFYENELRTLEARLESQEQQAREDVGRAHRISKRDRAHWTRIGETTESLTHERLTFARLEPFLARKASAASADGRRLAKLLAAEAEIPTRLDSLNGRLATLENLYEGANDRIAEFQGHSLGRRLGMLIMGVLVLELVVMVVGLFLRRR